MRLLAGTVLGFVLVVAGPWSAVAGPQIKIGDGTLASCTEAALISALLEAEALGGATIRFRCGAPVTIEIAQTLLVPDNTTIDGQGAITLHHPFLTFFVPADATATIRGFKLSGKVANAGTLTVVDVTFDGGFGVCGGAISNGGTLTVRRSTFTNNDGFFQGGAICNGGIATIQDSTFSDNGGGGGANGGGAIWNTGDLTVSGSTFAHNTSFHDLGGAIYNGGALTVRNSIFFQNEGGAGGAIFNDALIFSDAATLIIHDSVFLENSATGASFLFVGGHGGAIYNFGGTATIADSLISGNVAVRSGGGVYSCCGGTTTVKDTSVTGNTPDDIVEVAP